MANKSLRNMGCSIIIGWNTARELIRDKLFYNLLLFALILIFSSLFFSRITIAGPERVILNIGLSSINLFGVVISVLMGITLVSREIERRTIYMLVTKPVSRSTVVIGKFMGLCLTLFLNMFVMTIGFMGVLWLTQVSLPVAMGQSLAAMYLELVVIVAIGLFFSTFTTTTLSAMFTVSIYIIGESVTHLRILSERVGGAPGKILTGISYVVPNLEVFNLKGRVLYQESLTIEEFSLLLLYGIVCTTCLLVLASATFQRRDLA